MSLSSLVRVVLVEPAESLNIGSVARAMGNFGFDQLALVRPHQYNEAKALITACHGDFVVHQAKQFDSFEAAIADATDVVGFTARDGTNRFPVPIKQWVSELSGVVNQQSRLALVFGPEDTGLRVEHLEQCRVHVQIPSYARCSSFNLAQAVLLALYEVRNELESFIIPEPDISEPTWNEFHQLDRIITSVATKSEFYREGTPEPIPRIVMNLLRRMRPNVREMGILLALWSRIDKTLTRGNE